MSDGGTHRSVPPSSWTRSSVDCARVARSLDVRSDRASSPVLTAFVIADVGAALIIGLCSGTERQLVARARRLGMVPYEERCQPSVRTPRRVRQRLAAG